MKAIGWRVSQTAKHKLRGPVAVDEELAKEAYGTKTASVFSSAYGIVQRALF
jgi:hypothetical protein